MPQTVPAPAPAENGSPRPTGHRFADRTRVKPASVHALLAAGHSRRSIQRQLGMTYRTVQRLADAARPEDLFQGQWQNRPTKLDDFKPYLHERWAEGCTNAWTLWEEIKTHGYTAATEPSRLPPAVSHNPDRTGSPRQGEHSPQPLPFDELLQRAREGGAVPGGEPVPDPAADGGIERHNGPQTHARTPFVG
ncbi:hypothetical protein [Streptomyces sp. NBC_00306]|uniref:hypothetical protein n=1 Tax=Streptomyces sp. NBC_00306 TaxID=2975708 RepID=UPI002E2B4588|nr:hypothetical protein [Streptomyces sp. NBC_00306]